MARTREEVVREFHEQVQSLRYSAEGYDGGLLELAKPMATTICLLVHDKGQSNSLLAQLGVRDKVTFFSSARRVNPYNLLGEMPLVTIDTASGGRFIPICYSRHRPRLRGMSFARWWNEPIFLKGKISLSRKEVAKSIRDRDGGAHYDPKLNARYRGIASDRAFDWRRADGTPFEPGPQRAAMRQIVWEFDHSIPEIWSRLTIADAKADRIEPLPLEPAPIPPWNENWEPGEGGKIWQQRRTSE